MKKIYLAAAAVLVFAAALSLKAFVSPMKPEPRPTDSRGHVLVQLWEKYYKAEKKDLPATQSEIARKIISEAENQHLAWDFYEGWQKYVKSGGQRNWKVRDSLDTEFGRAVASFDEPIVSFSRMSAKGGGISEKWNFISSEEKRLKSSRNSSFYKYGSTAFMMEGVLSSKISNDWEYALWSVLPGRGNPTDGYAEDPVYKELASYLDGVYPQAAYLEYLAAMKFSDRARRKAELEKVYGKYGNKAIGLYAKADLLDMKKDSLDRARATSEQYKAFDAECRKFEAVRKSLSGEEGKLVTNQLTVKGLLEELSSRQLDVRVRNGKAVVSFRNLGSAGLSLTRENNKKVLFSRTVANPIGSFYVIDTAEVVLPELDDGSYSVRVTSGKIGSEDSFQRYTISLARHHDSRGYSVYTADYLSGEPLDKAEIILEKNGKVIARHPDFAMDGTFVLLPEDVSLLIDKKSYYQLYVRAKGDNGLMRESRKLPVGRYDMESFDYEERDGNFCNLFTDRGAYNPGDSVYFKGVLYEGNLRTRVRVEDAGLDVEVRLFDTEGNTVETKKLVTNEFGSVAGVFAIPEGLRNGTFRIELKNDVFLEDKYIRVDEFVLPTFDITLDKREELYLPGDAVHVRGHVTSYTGHPLSSARLSYKVTTGADLVAEGSLNPSGDGGFDITFPTAKDESWQNFEVVVTVLDETGETQEATDFVSVGSYLRVDLEMLEKADAQFDTIGAEGGPHYYGLRYRYDGNGVMDGDTAKFVMKVENQEGNTVPVDISYMMTDDAGKRVFEGKASSGQTVTFDMAFLPDGLYHLKAQSVLEDSRIEKEAEAIFHLVKLSSDAVKTDAPLDNYFRCLGTVVEAGGDIRVQMACANGPVWAVAEIYGDRNRLLETHLVRLAGKRGAEGSVVNLSYKYKEEWPEAVWLRIFYFKDRASKEYSRDIRKKVHTLELPFSFKSFEDKALPGKKYSFSIGTLPGVEAVASVFDKSTERFSANMWSPVRASQFFVPHVYIDDIPGIDSAGWDDGGTEEMLVGAAGGVSVRTFGRARNVLFAKSSDMMEEAESVEMVEDEASMENVLAAYPAAEMDDALMEGIEDVEVRDNFAKTLSFQPFLRSSDDGTMNLEFETGDMLSTFVVQLFAHDKSMRNNVLRQEMVVSMPVQLSVAEPGYLYSGDTYHLAASVSSVADAPVSGTLSLLQYDGADHENSAPVLASSKKVTVPAGESVSCMFDVKVPQTADTSRVVGLKLVFVSEGENSFSDALFVSVPVHPSAQVLTEAHSAVLLAGMDKDELIGRIRSQFVNTSAYGAEYKEISIKDMVLEALPGKVEPSGNDVLSLSEAYYVGKVAAMLGAPVSQDPCLLDRIMACRNADGGFGWFEGMQSSPVITAVLLERFAKLAGTGAAPSPDLDSSVKFLDNSFFRVDWPFWCGGISTDQYLHVRSMYPSVPFEVKDTGGDFDKRMREFRKYVRRYLVPSDSRGLNGEVFAKTRRLSTLSNLVHGNGTGLAKAWGVTLGTGRKLQESLDADVESLLQYAVSHKDGGIYYPNLVMPFRGLLESEAYAHSMLCDLMSRHAAGEGSRGAEARKVADGIRIWLMLQKETQKWDDDPAFVDAVNSVLSGGEDVLSTSVLLMTKTYEKPFEWIKDAGNGFRISRHFFRETSSEDPDRPGVVKVSSEEIRPGTVLHRGEKIRVEYQIWNGENRSFVRLTAPREAALRPVQQLSGMYGWGMRPMMIGGWFSFQPHGYRDVHADRTVFYFDSYPEENTTVSEEFFVTQEGVFSAPVVEIESLYAPHYRANALWQGRMETR